MNATITAVPGSPTIEITRDFAAPVASVWRCFVEPDLLAQWMGPDRLTCEIEENDVRHGGSWRMVHRDDEGHEFAFRGVYHGEQSPEKSIRTFEWAGLPGHVSLESMHIEDLGNGSCRVHSSTVFMSVEDRDGMVDNGMDVGVDEGYARLDKILTSLSPSR